jgi:hypothetical protein
LNYISCDSKVEHPKGLKLGFNSMFQIIELLFQKGWHYCGLLESNDVTNFLTQQTPNLKTQIPRSNLNIRSRSQLEISQSNFSSPKKMLVPLIKLRLVEDGTTINIKTTSPKMLL